MTVRALVMVCAVLFSSLATSTRAAASSDVVLEWNEIAVNTMLTPPAATPFGQARFAAIVQLAVFEAVNTITHDYQPYLGTPDVLRRKRRSPGRGPRQLARGDPR